MVNNVFKKGFESVENMKQEQQASKGNGIYDFYVKDKEDALMRFLTDEPIAFKAHTIKVGKNIDEEVETLIKEEVFVMPEV